MTPAIFDSDAHTTISPNKVVRPMKLCFASLFLNSAVLLCVVCFISQNAAAQISEPPDPYKATLDRLQSLLRQAETEWRYHTDVPHPEDPAVNDSDWEVFKV